MYVTFDLPEIPEYASGFPQYWVKITVIRPPSTSYQINALAHTYVRLVEAALVEYGAGAIKLKEFWDTHTSFNLGAMHRSMSHFEACISNMHRATNCFQRLRRQRDPLATALNDGEKAKFASPAISDTLRKIRHDILHLEDMVLKGRITDGHWFALAPNGPEVAHPTEADQTVKTIDRLTIGTREVTFRELATWLREMASFAVRMTDFLPSSSAPSHPADTA